MKYFVLEEIDKYDVVWNIGGIFLIIGIYL